MDTSLLEEMPEEDESDSREERAFRMWMNSLGLDAHEVEALVRKLEATVPYVYTKLKSIKLQGNESLLTYLCVRKLVMDQRCHAEGGCAAAPRLDAVAGRQGRLGRRLLRRRADPWCQRCGRRLARPAQPRGVWM